MMNRKHLIVALASFCLFQSATELRADAKEQYGVKPDLKSYPQSTAKEALTSILQAVEKKQHDYLLAHLADPDWVEKRVKSYGGKFDEVVEETKDRLTPLAVKRLKRFLENGKWTVTGKEALVTYDKVPSRVVRFRQIDDRWFLQNDYDPK